MKDITSTCSNYYYTKICILICCLIHLFSLWAVFLLFIYTVQMSTYIRPLMALFFCSVSGSLGVWSDGATLPNTGKEPGSGVWKTEKVKESEKDKNQNWKGKHKQWGQSVLGKAKHFVTCKPIWMFSSMNKMFKLARWTELNESFKRSEKCHGLTEGTAEGLWIDEKLTIN